MEKIVLGFVTCLICPSQRGRVLCLAVHGHAPVLVLSLAPVLDHVLSVVHARGVHVRDPALPPVAVDATHHVHAHVPSHSHAATALVPSPETHVTIPLATTSKYHHCVLGYFPVHFKNVAFQSRANLHSAECRNTPVSVKFLHCC